MFWYTVEWHFLYRGTVISNLLKMVMHLDVSKMRISISKHTISLQVHQSEISTHPYLWWIYFKMCFLNIFKIWLNTCNNVSMNNLVSQTFKTSYVSQFVYHITIIPVSQPVFSQRPKFATEIFRVTSQIKWPDLNIYTWYTEHIRLNI